MGVIDDVRRGRGPFAGPLKRAAKQVLQFHLPAGGPLKPAFGLLYRVHVGTRESAAWLARFLWLEPLFRSRCAAIGAGFCMEQLPYVRGHGRIVIGDNVRLSGKQVIGFSPLLPATPELVSGNGSFVGHLCE